jgi:hypothetical protein
MMTSLASVARLVLMFAQEGGTLRNEDDRPSQMSHSIPIWTMIGWLQPKGEGGEKILPNIGG